MFDKKITAQLQEIPIQFPPVISESSLHYDIDDLLRHYAPYSSYGVIDDVNTNTVSGSRISKALSGNANCVNITLENGAQANDRTVENIRSRTAMCDVLVAVGGGTINDLCKYAAHLDKKPYVVFPTCASMNGYLSANASISVDNHKTTFAASLPKAVLCDIGIIAKAPSRLSKSGLGDSLARPTAQADWLLSHLLLGTDYNETPFSLIVDVEVELFEGAAGIAKNDAAAIKLLMQLLLLSGIGMTIAGGSYPASQGEHMIAHTYNMLAKTTSRTLHGEEIGITSLHMAKRQQSILNSKPQLCSGEFDFDYMSSLFGSELAREFEIEFSKKQTLVASLREGSADEAIHNQERTGLLGRAHNDYFISPTKWDEAREKIEKVTMTPSQMENIIKKAELLDNIKALGWNKETYETAYKTARFTRDRFTFLDLKN